MNELVKLSLLGTGIVAAVGCVGVMRVCSNHQSAQPIVIQKEKLSPLGLAKVDLGVAICKKCGQNVTKEGVLACMADVLGQMDIEFPAEVNAWSPEQRAAYQYILQSGREVYHNQVSAERYVTKLNDEIARLNTEPFIEKPIDRTPTFILRGELKLNEYNGKTLERE